MTGADPWTVADGYEHYVGRWSRRVAEDSIAGLTVTAEARWLDVGCGTGALTGVVLEQADPRLVVGADPALPFLDAARRTLPRDRCGLCAADARALPFEEDASFHAAVSALALNFVPHPRRAVAEMVRVTAPGGHVAGYAWDYADGMEMIRVFWESAVALNPEAADRAEGRRFPLCRPAALTELCRAAGLDGVSVRPIVVPTHFRDFDDFWDPFLGGQGPAPGYVASLTEPDRTALARRLAALLPVGSDGSIALTARACAVTGVCRRA